jgi:hypothetical protein
MKQDHDSKKCKGKTKKKVWKKTMIFLNATFRELN